MFCENHASHLIRDLMTRVVRLFDAGRLVEEIDRLPREMTPRTAPALRCCIHKDRAVIKNRLLAILGIRVEEARDELEVTPLAEYARRALARPAPPREVLTVIDEACSGCIQVKYHVTDVCRKCVARPCAVNCPKQAIEFFRDRAHIDHAKCVNCGICQKVCPYHAIAYVPIPCEEACPVDAIRKNAEGTQDIDFGRCIFCGNCVDGCPFGAIMDVSHLIDILRLLRADPGGEAEGAAPAAAPPALATLAPVTRDESSPPARRRVVAMLAPAIVGQFPGTLAQLMEAVRRLGFAEVVEVARGADVAAVAEAREFRERRARGDPFMTTSCCPSYNQLVEKHLPDLKPLRSVANTPMHYTARLVREADPAAVVVFVGPCVAKRREILDDAIVDHYLSFEELAALLAARGIEPARIEPVADTSRVEALAGGRGFPLTGGVAAAIAAQAGPDAGVQPVCIDGLTRATVQQLRQFATSRTCPGTLVEVMACTGGCVGGANVITNPKVTAARVKALVAASRRAPAGD